jgi:hypothetical protein
MANRREEKERLREIREEAEKREASEQRRKLLVGYGVAGVLAAAVVAGILVLVLASGGSEAKGNAHIVSAVGFTTTEDLKPDEREGTKTKAGPLASAEKLPQAAKAANCVLRNPPDEGHQHLSTSQPTPDYKSDPPTSGNHDQIPLANGVYDSPITNFRHAVHTLEHGRIEVEYQSSLPEDAQLKLKGVIDEDFRDMVMFQNDESQWQVSAAAWGHYLGCKTYNDKVLDAIRAFRDKYRGNGPESVASQPS